MYLRVELEKETLEAKWLPLAPRSLLPRCHPPTPNWLLGFHGWGQLPSLARRPHSGLPLRWRSLLHLGRRSENRSRSRAERFPPGREGGSGCPSLEDKMPWERCRPRPAAFPRGGRLAGLWQTGRRCLLRRAVMISGKTAVCSKRLLGVNQYWPLL